jgi:acid stress-induced BolA-like protein IbaG/YrbA
MISPEQVQTMIQERLANAEVKVVGDGQHFEAVIVSPDFEGKTRVKQYTQLYNLRWQQKQFMLYLSKPIHLKLGRQLVKLFKMNK